MSEITRCKRCLLPSSLNQLTFDEQGICNHCRKYEHDFANWDEIKNKKKREFESILEQAKKLNRPYDCLVPLSGGKDSTYALYLTTKVYKLRTLAVTLDNGYLSDLAKENIKNALANCDADHIFYHINKANSSLLFKEFVVRTGDFCNACMRGINYAIEISLKSFNIPLVIKGSGRRVQYVSQIKELFSLNTPSYYAKVLKGSPIYRKFIHLARNKNTLEFQKIAGGMADVLGLQRNSLMRFTPQHIGMYDYIYLPVNEIIEIIKREMGWSDFGGTAEHLDCDLHDVPFHKNTLIVSNITKSTFHNSGLLRQGILTKEEALKIEAADMAIQELPKDLVDFLAAHDLSYEEYLGYVRNSDNQRFVSKVQKIAREIYHRFRKF